MSEHEFDGMPFNLICDTMLPCKPFGEEVVICRETSILLYVVGKLSHHCLLVALFGNEERLQVRRESLQTVPCKLVAGNV